MSASADSKIAKAKEAEEKAKKKEEAKEQARKDKEIEAKKNQASGKKVFKNGLASVIVTADELAEYQAKELLVGYDPMTKVALIKQPDETVAA